MARVGLQRGEGGDSRSQWPRGLRRGSAAAPLQGLWVRIQRGAWMFVCCDCCVLSEVSATGRSLVQRSSTECVCVSECHHESSKMRRPWPTGELLRHCKNKRNEYIVHVPRRTRCVSFTEISRLVPLNEIISVYFEELYETLSRQNY